MKTYGKLFFYLTSILLFLDDVATAQTVNKAVFVIVDGIPADVIKKIATPNLDAIAGESGFAEATVGGTAGSYSETPTISAVGYNSLLTGTWANKHNVWDNDIAAPNYHYPTIFRLMKDQYPSRTTAIFSSWSDNRTKLVGDSLPETRFIKTDYHFDGLELDTLNYPHDRQKKHMHLIDEAVVAKAAETIRMQGPDLSWIYLEYTDDMGHMYGDSKEFYDAVEMMDKQMGKIWSAIQTRAKAADENWQIYITTDHGRDSVSGKGHGGQSTRERSTWIVTNAKHLNDRFNTGKARITDIMPSIAEHLGVKIPKEVAMEIDGSPLTSVAPFYDLRAVLRENRILLEWSVNAKSRNRKAKIWLTTTNNFREGKPDKYNHVGVADLERGKAIVDVRKHPAKFYKIVLESDGEFINSWIVPVQ